MRPGPDGSSRQVVDAVDPVRRDENRPINGNEQESQNDLLLLR